MKRLLDGFAASVLWSFIFVNALPAQVLITGENGGKGSQALMVSRPVKFGGRTVTPYGGVNRLTPLGRASDPIFTPPSAVYNGIVGVSVPLGKVTFFLEYNPGGIQRSGGMGALYVFPQHAPPAAGAPPAGESSEKRNSL